MEYNFRGIEKKWNDKWKSSNAYKVFNESFKPKFYVLDMFPYPSGAGLHVGHPLGYIASDIFSRYKRLKGFNVLHPMGYDAFGLPAEQYAIEHGVHPAVSTNQNINNFRKQLDNIGFCYDWDREIKTSDPTYYKWTQWIFLQLFHSFYNRIDQRAEHIIQLIESFETEGNIVHKCPGNEQLSFSADDWNGFENNRKQEILMLYRLAYCGYGEVNWCEALGTVLANDEVVNGVSERGGHPVVRKKLRQWYLRITEYADRLLEGLNRVDFSDAMKEMQTNWIGKSEGTEINLIPVPSPLVEKDAFVQQNSLAEAEGGSAKRRSGVPKYSVLSPMQYELAKQNRKEHTEAEAALWKALRGNNLGENFRRQHPIDAYIVDFVCLQKSLIIEVDGGYHENQDQKIYDENRTYILNNIGFRVIRFTNEDVVSNLEEVIKKIRANLTPQPLSTSGEGRRADTIANVTSNSDREAPFPTCGEGTGLGVYTTRPDTIFGVDFIVMAPEHELVSQITTSEQRKSVEEYLIYVKSRSERERQAEKKITGCFTGGYVLHPFTNKKIPIWISEYVLAGYGTGAIMGVPCGDERDFRFATHFNIPITNILGDAFNGKEANPSKDVKLTNSDFLDGMVAKDATDAVNKKLMEMGIGQPKVNYRMRDAAFSRQRYWGEPFPIKWQNGIAEPLPENELPLLLPEVDSYSPGPNGEGPLANIPAWVEKELETNTMPGYAGSSWYFLRYMDPYNDKTFCDRKVSDYWNQVDIYIGGTEHAVGHLLYSRMWTKALYDLGFIGFDEPFKKLVNQGMIQGSSRFIYRVQPSTLFGEDEINATQIFISFGINEKLSFGEINNKWLFEKISSLSKELSDWLNQKNNIPTYTINKIHVDVNIVDGVELNIEAFKKWRNGEYANASFILEDGSVLKANAPLSTCGEGLGVRYLCGAETEKMSKSKFNTVNPDDLVLKYGADTFRMYEMFLGPIEVSKPWDTKGIEGVHRFLKKLWRLFFDEAKGKIWNDDAPTNEELKVLHKTIKKIEDDTERFAFNTAVSAFMIAVNELTDLTCHKKSILQPLVIMLTPYAPHIAEELYNSLNNYDSVLDASFPVFEEKYVTETNKEYPISINGKVRTTITFPLDAAQADIEKQVLANELVQKWMENKPPKKIIFVKGKMINVVA